MEYAIPAPYIAEMSAMAKAAEVPYEDLLLANLSVELFSSSLCSCIVAAPSASAEHETLFGRNLDWHGGELLVRSGLLLVAAPDEGQPFVSVSYPGLVGVFTGVNKAGLAVADLTILLEEMGQLKGIPYPFLQRQVLETCHDRGEARRLIEGASRTVPQNMMVADREGGTLLELTSQSVRIRPSEGGIATATNGFHEDETPKTAGRRYQVLRACCDGKPINVERLMAQLRKAAIPSMNIQCCLFRLGSMKGQISCNTLPASDGPFVEVDFGKLLHQ